MGRVISISNQKGGVGKTTTAINLSSSIAVAEYKTLLIDIDPQANATSGLGVEIGENHKTIYEIIIDKTKSEEEALRSSGASLDEGYEDDEGSVGLDPHEAITPTKVPFLDIIPSNIRLVGAEVELVNVPDRERILQKAIQVLKDEYDFIIIDCPPSLGLLTLNSLTAADGVIIPIQCEYFALEGLSQLLNTIRLVQKQLNPNLTIDGVLLTMYDSRLNLSNQVVEEVRKYFQDKVFETVISRNVRIAEAPSHGKPVILYDAVSTGTANYLNLAEEVIKNGR